MDLSTRTDEAQSSPASYREKRQALGQFFTPEPIARFMASLFNLNWPEVRLLDAGAGAGALTQAFVQHLSGCNRKPKSIVVTAYEIDPAAIDPLEETMMECRRVCESAGVKFISQILNVDFLASAAPMVRDDLFQMGSPLFNAAILNPPYRKIQSDSPSRRLLRSAGIETSNLYPGFVALASKLLVHGGEMVAITPRSFCNGPYFKPFRKDLLDTMSLRRLHVFESRSAAFKRDDVLQENIIIHAVKGAPKPERVTVSSSSGEPGAKVTAREVPYEEIVLPGDADQFIHLAEEDGNGPRALISTLRSSLPELGLSVSTGRVVDFRVKEFLKESPGKGTAPLIYPCHFNGGYVVWPKLKTRKPNAIENASQTEGLLVPAGIYVLVKRFTSKEERKRIVACIYDSHHIKAPWVGFENHLNYFHAHGQGLTIDLAKGLSAFLNSTLVDTYFRQFNGHTQVNATDLRSLGYPKKSSLEQLGRRINGKAIPQNELDALILEELF